jgi:putative hydrolase of the HAD superfamily
MIKLVTLDVTNTLIRVARSPGYQYAYIGLKYGLQLDENVLTGLFLKYYKVYSQKYPNFGAQSGMSAHSWWSLLVKDCFHDADSRIPEKCLSLLADDIFFHYTTSQAWEFLPGAFDAIKDLRQHPIKLGVISNWDHRLYQVLVAMKLLPYFDFILPSSVVGAQKPDRCIFQLALQMADCLPHEAVHFGDSLEKDFFGARGAGMHAYLLDTSDSHHAIDQSLVVSSVQEFVNTIRPQLVSKDAQNMLNNKETL